MERSSDTRLDRWISWVLIIVAAAMPLVFLPRSTGYPYPLLDIFLLPKLLWLRLGTLALIALLLAKVYRNRHLSLSLSLVDIGLLAFLTVGVISFRYSLDPRQAMLGGEFWQEGLVTYANYALLFFVAKAYLGEQGFMRLAKAIVLVSLLISFQALRTAANPAVMSFTGIPWNGRVGSTVGNAAILGTYYALALPFMATLLFTGRYRGFWAYVVAASLFLSVPAAVLTYSRGAWLALAIAGVLVVLIVRRLGFRLEKVALGFTITGAILVMLFLIGLKPTQPAISATGRALSVLEPQEVTAATRLSVWRQTLRLIPKHRLVGVGFDNYGKLLETRIGKDKDLVPMDKPHNYFLEMLISVGELGFLALCLFLLVFLRAALALVRRPPDSQGTGEDDGIRPVLAAVAVGTIGYLIAIGFLFSTVNATPLLFALMGTATALLQREEGLWHRRFEADLSGILKIDISPLRRLTTGRWLPAGGPPVDPVDLDKEDGHEG